MKGKRNMEEEIDKGGKRAKKGSYETPVKKASETSSSEDLSSSESEEEETDVKMRVAPSTNANKKASPISDKDGPKTHAHYQTQTSGSKTLFVGNLSLKVIRDEVEKFFKKAGKITRVDLKEYCHVEFATEEAAQKALALEGKKLLGGTVRLELARERALNIPERGRKNSSFQKGGTSQGQTIYINGFDMTLSEDQIRSSLKEHFGSCGEVSCLSIPTYCGAPKGFAFMDFKDQDGFSKALEFNGSDLGGCRLKVEKAYLQYERQGRDWNNGGAGVRDRRGSRAGWDGGGGFSGRSSGGGGWEEHETSDTKNWSDGGGSRDGWAGGAGFSGCPGGGGGWGKHGTSDTKNWGDGGGSRDGGDGGGGGWEEH